MIRGLYTSALGMTTQMKKMDVVANNIANVNTTGYKKDMVVTQTFSEQLMKRLDDPSDAAHSSKVGNITLGVFVDDIYSDFSNGSLRQTDSTLDVALTGKGFMAVSVADKSGSTSEKYTRDGSLTLSDIGTLVTKNGDAVMGQNGIINIPNGDISIDENGSIYSGGEFVDRIKTVDFNDTHSLRKSGDNLFDVTDQSEPIAFTGKIVQGYLENSNVNSIKEMVDMITVNRNYEANQRMVTFHDETLGRAVNDIARK